MKKSESIKQLIVALIKARGFITGAVKDSKNPFFKSDYANLESVIDSTLPHLLENGIVVSQLSGILPTGQGYIETMIMHESGEWMCGEFPIDAPGNDPQKLGSATTYSRRYALAAAIGITQIDDDGEGAKGRGPQGGNQIKPDSYGQPPHTDRANIDRGYVIDFGKWNRRTLEQIYRELGEREIEDYVVYIESQAKKQNKPVMGSALKFIQEAEQFLRAMQSSNNDRRLG